MKKNLESLNFLSFGDFLLHLFPCVLGIIGIYVIIFLMNGKNAPSALELNITFNIVIIIISYCIGMVLSNISSFFFLPYKNI